MKINVGLVDDHQLFLKSLSLMLETLKDFQVVVEALNGQDLQHKLKLLPDPPDLLLIDVNMPLMGGVETASWLQANYPNIKLIALTQNDKESSIIQMFKSGCCTYLLKDVHPSVLEKVLLEVHRNGFYNADTMYVNPAKLFRSAEKTLNITPKENIFLQLVCSERTYKHIALEMKVSERTVDGYRESLFQKFGVQSRVGLCLEAVRKGFVEL